MIALAFQNGPRPLGVIELALLSLLIYVITLAPRRDQPLNKMHYHSHFELNVLLLIPCWSVTTWNRKLSVLLCMTDAFPIAGGSGAPMSPWITAWQLSSRPMTSKVGLGFTHVQVLECTRRFEFDPHSWNSLKRPMILKVGQGFTHVQVIECTRRFEFDLHSWVLKLEF